MLNCPRLADGRLHCGERVGCRAVLLRALHPVLVLGYTHVVQCQGWGGKGWVAILMEMSGKSLGDRDEELAVMCAEPRASPCILLALESHAFSS